MHIVKYASKFSCQECAAEFEQGSNLKTHMATHPGEIDLFLATSVGQYFPIVVIGRDICKHIQEQDFLNDNLKRHMRTHTGKGPSKCSSCFVELV